MCRMAHKSCISRCSRCGHHHRADEDFSLPCVVHCRLLSVVHSHGYYCSSSPASVNAASAFPTDAPQTTLVAEAVPVLDPHTTLNALSALLFQGRELPQTTEFGDTLEFPYTSEIVPFCGLKTAVGERAVPVAAGARSVFATADCTFNRPDPTENRS